MISIFSPVIVLNLSTECGSHKDSAKMLSKSLSFFFPLFYQKSTSMCPLFSQLLYYTLKRGFLVLLSFLLSFTLLLFPQQYDSMLKYLPHFLHSPLNNFPFLLIYLFSLGFNTITFSAGSIFSCVLITFSSVFQNQRISFFSSLYSILTMLTL